MDNNKVCLGDGCRVMSKNYFFSHRWLIAENIRFTGHLWKAYRLLRFGNKELDSNRGIVAEIGTVS